MICSFCNHGVFRSGYCCKCGALSLKERHKDNDKLIAAEKLYNTVYFSDLGKKDSGFVPWERLTGGTKRDWLCVIDEVVEALAAPRPRDDWGAGVTEEMVDAGCAALSVNVGRSAMRAALDAAARARTPDAGKETGR